MSIRPAHFQEGDDWGPILLNIHGILDRSRANGPGIRTSIWFQGCTLHCPACFNPDTHSKEPAHLMTVCDLLARVMSHDREIEGITVTGGEPLQQAEGLLALLLGVRSATSLSVVLFSGFSERQIRRMRLGDRILQLVDVLVAGRYVAQSHLGTGLRGSANQQVHLLTPRYQIQDLMSTPASEIHIDPHGNALVSGILPPVLSIAGGQPRIRL
jgi:anaerobic ribonucleoside-triphosphate reductase activating protein